MTQCTEVRFASFLSGWIYYYGSNKSTGKETGKTHLCAVKDLFNSIEMNYFGGDCILLLEFSQFLDMFCCGFDAYFSIFLLASVPKNAVEAI